MLEAAGKVLELVNRMESAVIWVEPLPEFWICVGTYFQSTMSESNRYDQFCDLFQCTGMHFWRCSVAASGLAARTDFEFLQVNAELLAFLIEMASFQSQGARGLRDVAVVLVEFAEYLRAFEG